MPEIEEITDGAGLAALEPDWWDLWKSLPEATPFQSPAWLLPWWRHFGSDRLLTLALRREGRLTGLVPVYVLEESGRRKLLPLGIGISDYLDPLLDRQDAPAVLAHLAGGDWDFERIDLEGQRAGSPLLDAPWPFGADLHDDEPCPALRLPDPEGDLLRVIPRLRKHAYHVRRAEKLGSARLEAATADTLAEWLDALFALHAARWAPRGEPGVLGDPTVRAFHREAATALLDAGLLRLWGLGIDGRPVAVFYGFADRQRLHFYLGGYDPTLTHPGLGALMIGHAILQARAEGLAEVHFLRGREPYKYAWGAVDLPLLGRSLRK